MARFKCAINGNKYHYRDQSLVFCHTLVRVFPKVPPLCPLPCSVYTLDLISDWVPNGRGTQLQLAWVRLSSLRFRSPPLPSPPLLPLSLPSPLLLSSPPPSFPLPTPASVLPALLSLPSFILSCFLFVFMLLFVCFWDRVFLNIRSIHQAARLVSELTSILLPQSV